MPAVTVDDPLVLPKIRPPGPGAVERSVVSVTTAPSGLEGEGFPVYRAFAGAAMAAIDPFVHMDQMGEVDYAPGEPKGTPWHPHRGFETVTYIIDGVFDHQDSNGGGGRITNGDTQWMTAGAGILHIEAPPEFLVASGGLFHGIQLWVNLPAAEKWNPPRYQDLRASTAALLSSPDGGALVRVIAGEIAGQQGPGVTYTPITLAHATLSPGSELVLPWRADFNALVYVLAGRGVAGVERRPAAEHQLVVFGPGDTLRVGADPHQEGRHPNLEILLLGGRPIREPVVHYGPFVMNSRAEIAQALADYQAGRLGHVPASDLPHRHPGDIDLDQPKKEANVAEICEHLQTLKTAEFPPPRTPDGCEECLVEGTRWVALRECLDCGHVGCCDSSPGTHATKHYRQSGHPVMRSVMPGDTWSWCYIHELTGELS